MKTLFFITFYFLSQASASTLDHALVSVYAVDTKNGKVVMEKNSDLSLSPASCLKLVTTAAALSLLGEQYQFETQLEYDGIIDKEGTLKGNLYLKGGGDPCLGSDRISLSWKEQIHRFAIAIKKQGVKRIEGALIADATLWEKTRALPSWEWGDIGNYYGTGASALAFHENAYSLTFKPGTQIGDPTQVLRTDPPLPLLSLDNEVTTGPEHSGDRACIYGCELSPTQLVCGTIPASIPEFTIKGALSDPGSVALQLLEEELKKETITVERRPHLESGTRTAFYTTYSPSVQQIVYETNKHSVNLYAEHLLKKMGEVMYKEGSTQAGIRAIYDFLQGQKIDLEGFYMIDGSGLSRKNLITTKQLVTLLIQMKKSKLFPRFFSSLPHTEGPTHAKTGSMSLTRSCAGYKGSVAFAIIINNCPDGKAANDKIQDILSKLDASVHSQK